jgi:OmpA-OmpF porin, OOP family
MNKVTRAGMALVLGLLALPTMAQEQEMRPYVFGGFQYTFQDDERNSAAGDRGYFLGAGKPFTKYWGLEFGAFHDSFDDSEPGRPNNWTDFGAEVDALFFYARERGFMPYVDLGAGVIRNTLRGTPDVDSTDPMVAAGLGFFKYFDAGSGNVGMRADVRYRWSDANDIPGFGNFGEPQFRVGLILALGPKGAAAATPGVGCADADHDGVCDSSDLCPDTPGSTKVNGKGCPTDADGDGIPDEKDKCPGTAKGTRVGPDGCPEESKTGPNRRFEDIHFEFDHSDLTDYGKALLDSDASTINGLTQKYPKLKVELSGHTDWIGTDAYNQALSERRANSVKQYLVRKGVSAGRISTYAYGESKPIATNDTAEGRALNRRTEVRTRE